MTAGLFALAQALRRSVRADRFTSDSVDFDTQVSRAQHDAWVDGVQVVHPHPYSDHQADPDNDVACWGTCTGVAVVTPPPIGAGA